MTPLRTTAMSSPTVPPQPKANNRISNFSVASLLADTRPKSPSAGLENTDLLISATNLSTSPDRRLNQSPLSTSPAHHLAALSHHHQQQLQHQQQLAQSQLGDPKSHSHLTKLDRLAHPARTVSHNSSEQQNGAEGHETESEVEYDSNQEDEEEDSMVDIEDCNDNDSRSSQSPKHMRSPSSQAPNHVGGPVPIRPTPFSALAAAAVAWGGVPWPGARQMPPFGPPGLFPGQFGPGGVSGKNN